MRARRLTRRELAALVGGAAVAGVTRGEGGFPVRRPGVVGVAKLEPGETRSVGASSAGAAMVSALEEAMVAAGQPRLKDWERMVLVWSLTGLDLSSVDVPQPYRAVVGVSIVAGGRVYKMRQEETEPEEIEQGTPDFGG